MSISDLGGAVKPSNAATPLFDTKIFDAQVAAEAEGWRAAGPYSILDGARQQVASFAGVDKVANRAFVLVACRNHADLAASHAELLAAAAGFQAAQTRWDEADLFNFSQPGDEAELQKASKAFMEAHTRLNKALVVGVAMAVRVGFCPKAHCTSCGGTGFLREPFEDVACDVCRERKEASSGG